MKSWPMEDAEVRFSELLNACLADGPQMVTRRGVEVAVRVSKDEWQRLTRAARRDAVGKGPRFRRRAAP